MPDITMDGWTEMSSMNVKLEGEALKLYLMKRFNRTEAEATQTVREAALAKATGQVECPECERDLGPDAMTCPTCSGGDNWAVAPIQTTDF